MIDHSVLDVHSVTMTFRNYFKVVEKDLMLTELCQPHPFEILKKQYPWCLMDLIPLKISMQNLAREM